jgi:hypothetical protein
VRRDEPMEALPQSIDPFRGSMGPLPIAAE